jgi:hypothetical protein
VGQAVTEGRTAASREAIELIENIAAALERSRKREAAEREKGGPARLAPTRERGGREDGR